MEKIKLTKCLVPFLGAEIKMKKIPKCQNCGEREWASELVKIHGKIKVFCDTCAMGLRIEKKEEEIKKAESKEKTPREKRSV